jgi:hypothetical protein
VLAGTAALACRRRIRAQLRRRSASPRALVQHRADGLDARGRLVDGRRRGDDLDAHAGGAQLVERGGGPASAEAITRSGDSASTASADSVRW